METQRSINNQSNVYILENKRLLGVKGDHIYLKKGDDVIYVKIKSKVKEQLSSSNEWYAETEDLLDMQKYYTGDGKTEKESKKIVEIIRKILFKKTKETLLDTEKQFISQSEFDKTFTLINLLRKSVSDFTLLDCVMESTILFPMIEEKCKKMQFNESLLFITNCLNYIHKPNKEHAKKIIFENFNPKSKDQINVEKVDCLFETMSLLVEDFEANKAQITSQITSKLQEILKLVSINFTNG